MVRRCGNDRPNRSSFQTTRQSPDLMKASVGQTCSISTAAADPILKQMTLIDTGSDQSITLQVQHLTVAIRGNAHVADQHFLADFRGKSANSFSVCLLMCQCRLKSPHLCRLKIPHSVTWPVCVDWWPSSSREMSVSSKALWKVNVL